MEQTRDAARKYEQCAQTTTSNAWLDMQRQQIEMNKALMDSSERMRNRLIEDAKFCYNIEKKYKPFGIQGPTGLECNEVNESSSVCRLKDPDQYDSSCESGKVERLARKELRKRCQLL